jgi:hypothetical protein
MVATTYTIQPQVLPRQRNGLPTTLGWKRIQRTRQVLLFLPLLGLAWQVVLAQTGTDCFAAFLAASGAFLVFYDAFRPKRLYRYPLSTLVLLGFGVTLQLGPLLFTAFEGNSITVNLEVPISTFGHGVLASLIAISSHWLYRNARIFWQVRKKIQQCLVQLKIFAPLDFKGVLLMGSLGLTAFAVGPLVADHQDSGNVFVKLLEGFRFFATIPVAFVLFMITGSSTISLDSSAHFRKRFAWFAFLIYIIALVFIGLLRNSRATFIFPLSCLFLGFALYWLFGLIRIRPSSFVAFCLAIIVGLPLVSDLASAMVMVRGLRGDLSPVSLVEQTLQQMEDRLAIERFRSQAREIAFVSDWSENYVSNLFLSRFSNAKYPDNSLENQGRISSAGRNEMLLFHWYRLISTLPAPALSLLGVSDQIKAEANSVSYGDKLYYLASGNRFALGGLRSGHFFGTGLAAFGFGYLVLLFVGFLLLFPLVDSHALMRFDCKVSPPIISPVAITQLLAWFLVSNSESVGNMIAYPLREFLEPVVLFALFRWIARPLKLL